MSSKTLKIPKTHDLSLFSVCPQWTQIALAVIDKYKCHAKLKTDAQSIAH